MTSTEIMNTMSVEQLENMVELFLAMIAAGRGNRTPEVEAALAKLSPSDVDTITSYLIAFDAERRD